MNFWRAAFCAITLASFFGCGGGTESGVVGSTYTESEACIGCHNGRLSAVTGIDISQEWKASTHNTDNIRNDSGMGASCGNCHQPQAGHPAVCGNCHGGKYPTGSGAHDVMTDPDKADGSPYGTICKKCHGPVATVKPVGLPHFGVYTTVDLLNSRVSTASYVQAYYGDECKKCHNPHDNRIRQQHKDWAQSGHGDTTGTPWIHYNNKLYGTPPPATPANSLKTDCVRCHTTTGYINYVSSNFTDIHAWGTASDNTKQTLYCNACHDDGNGEAYSFETRKVGSITGFYNYSNAQTKKLLISRPYPNVNTSNICMSCHTGRAIGETLKAAAVAGANLTNLNFVNSHYLTAGAIVFKVGGYEFHNYTSYYNSSYYKHDRIGLNNTDSTGTDGPCVTCHMKPGRHTFKPVVNNASTGKIEAISSTICGNCHSGYNAWTPEKLEEKKELFEAGLAALEAELAAKGFYFAERNPYFFTAPYNFSYVESGACSSNLPVKNWQTGGTSTFSWNTTSKSCASLINAVGTAGTGEGNMGAAYNYNLLKHDPGAFAHNSLYARRLIYDSIDYLDNEVIDYSVQTRLNSVVHQGKPYQTAAILYLLTPSGGRP